MPQPHHPEARFASPAELISHYAQISKRIRTAGERHEQRRRAAERLALADKFHERQRQRAKAAHEIARAIKTDRTVLDKPDAELTATGILRKVSLETGIPVEWIIGQDRTAPVYQARKDAIRRVHAARPHLSYPQIGAIFNRDHTTILHALGKTTKSRGRA